MRVRGDERRTDARGVVSLRRRAVEVDLVRARATARVRVRMRVGVRVRVSAVEGDPVREEVAYDGRAGGAGHRGHERLVRFGVRVRVWVWVG